jgi:hypothetical protein
MNDINRIPDVSGRSELVRMIEPLASYICATGQPRKALASALAVLFSEVQATNQAAIAHCQSHCRN